MGNFIKLLASYAPTTTNDASYDEHISKLVKKYNVEEIQIDNDFVKNLFNDFLQRPRNIIISGSAGDGKTYILRQLIKQFDEEKTFKNTIPTITYEDYTIKFIKDFTERDNQKEIIEELNDSIYNNSKILYFIAGNDGILIDKLREYKYLELLEDIENSMETHNNDKFILLDLSQTSSAKNFNLLLKKVIELFEKYETDCPSLSDDTIFCPIHSNIELLKDKQIEQKLDFIIRMSDLNYNHITLRKLFMIISNMILGYSGNKIFKSCKKAIEFSKSHSKLEVSFYNTFFGDNLTKTKKLNSPFYNLNELNIGYETNNQIDEMILYLDIDDKDEYLKIFNNKFFEYEIFSKLRDNYLETGEIDIQLKNYLIFLRRVLFFKKNDNNLLNYKFAKEFYEDVLLPLKENKNIKFKIITSLVLGLNRVFLGELTNESKNIYIAKSFKNTDDNISSEIIKKLDYKELKLSLIKGFDDDYYKILLSINDFNLELDLHMYEFLKRVAQGVLPTSFSVEYYERIKIFKSTLVKNYLEQLEDSFEIFTLDDEDGSIKITEIRIEDEYVSAI